MRAEVPPRENDLPTERIIGLAAQMLTYMKLSGIRTGLLLNFNSAVLKDGLRRLML